jgi:hypothetical protein
MKGTMPVWLRSIAALNQEVSDYVTMRGTDDVSWMVYKSYPFTSDKWVTGSDHQDHLPQLWHAG